MAEQPNTPADRWSSSVETDTRALATDLGDPLGPAYVAQIGPWDIGGNRQDSCLKTVIPLVHRVTGKYWAPSRDCLAWACGRCGPRRCQVILDDLTGHFGRRPAIFFAEVTDPDTKKASLRFLQRTGGAYVWFRLASGRVFLFASIDFAAKPKTKASGRPANTHALQPSAAIAQLDHLLRHGLDTRRASGQWRLRDSEYSRRNVDPQFFSVGGVMTSDDEQRLVNDARHLYAVEGGTSWPEKAAQPEDLTPGQLVALLRRSR